MYAAARRFTSSSTLASVYKAQPAKTLFAKNAKFSQHSNTNKQLMSQVGMVQKAFSHDVEISVKFVYDDQNVVLDMLKEHGGKVEQTSNINVTYFDNVPQDEVLPEAAEVAKDRPQTQERYTMTAKDSWLFKEITQDSTQWKCSYPNVEEGKTHLEQPLTSRVPMYQEANGEREIRRFLNLQQDMTAEARTGTKLPTLDEDLRKRLSVVPFAKIDYTETTVSVSPTINYANINVTLRDASFGYKLGTLKCSVQNISREMADDLGIHLLRLFESTKLNKLIQPHARSIVEEYLYRTRQGTHYKTLLEAGIRDDKLMDPETAKNEINAMLEKQGKAPLPEPEEEN